MGSEDFQDGDYRTHPFILIEHLPDVPRSIRFWLPPYKAYRVLGAYDTEGKAKRALIDAARGYAFQNRKELERLHLEQTFTSRTFALTFDPEGENFPQEIA